jgi:hypothetical protein
MLSAGFETAMPAIKWLRTHALDRKATWISVKYIAGLNIMAEMTNDHGCNMFSKNVEFI